MQKNEKQKEDRRRKEYVLKWLSESPDSFTAPPGSLDTGFVPTAETGGATRTAALSETELSERLENVLEALHRAHENDRG